MFNNMQKLKGKMKEKGFTQEMLSKEIGIDKSSLNRKLQKGCFLIGEADVIAKTLGLSRDEAYSIFFTHNVA
jgi:lambda repressor-like predicted transcriptional regulator